MENATPHGAGDARIARTDHVRQAFRWRGVWLVDATVLLAIAFGVGLLAVRFVGSADQEPPAVNESLPESVFDPVPLTVGGWSVTQSSINEASGYEPDAGRLRMRQLAAVAQDIPLPLRADDIETGLLSARVDWTRHERIGNLAIRETGSSPGTMALFRVQAGDPNGNRVIAWRTEIPMANGRLQVIETVRTEAAIAASQRDPAPTKE